MLRYIYVLILGFQAAACVTAQTPPGRVTRLFTGTSASVLFGPDVRIDGAIKNEGQLTFKGDVHLTNNAEVGKIAFTGGKDQQLMADSIVMDELTVDKGGGRLSIAADWSVVTNRLSASRGIISTHNTQFILMGSTRPDADGFIEGSMTCFSQGSEIIFPVGVNGLRNYLTVIGVSKGDSVKVECVIPDPQSLVPNDEMIGIADEMVWKVSLRGENEQEVRFTGDFSGLDLKNFVNRNTINAFDYGPALAVLTPDTSVFRPLSNAEIRDTDEVSYGIIESDQPTLLTREGITLALSIVPVQVRPIFYVPSAFSPTATNDENRVFRPYFAGANISSASFQVFDSLNKVIHQFVQSGENIDLDLSGWDGIIRGGDEAPEGVYYFSVTLIAEGEQYKKVGTVLLVK